MAKVDAERKAKGLQSLKTVGDGEPIVWPKEIVEMRETLHGVMESQSQSRQGSYKYKQGPGEIMEYPKRVEEEDRKHFDKAREEYMNAGGEITPNGYFSEEHAALNRGLGDFEKTMSDAFEKGRKAFKVE